MFRATNFSICPKNWKLPTADSAADKKGDYTKLTFGLDATEILEAPYYFTESKAIIDGATNIQGRAWYYSSSISSNTHVWGLAIPDSGKVYTTGIYYYDGAPIRCLASKEVDNIEIIVDPTISLDVADEVNVEKSETNPSAADLDVKVTSNQSYTIGISTTNPNLTSITSNVKIPAKSGLLNTAENGWGIKLKDDTEFTALTSDLQTFYTASGAEIKTIPFTIGISTAPGIPNGEYSTDITITATQN